MPIGLGLASSHAPNMFIPPEDWERRYRQAVGDVPQPLAAAKETIEVRRDYVRRMDAAWAALRDRLKAYRPDALIMVSDDHNETFNRASCMPTIAIHTGEAAEGGSALVLREADSSTRVRLTCHQGLAGYLASGLVKRGFDLAIKSEPDVVATGQPDRGMGHGFTRTAPKIMPALDIPVVLLWLNCYFEPLPTARRCLEFGRALADLLKARPERVAIYGTGGLSHDPRGPRGGWIDEPLDRSVLQAFADGEPDRLSSLFDLDSDTLRGGTGEIRNWLVVGGAMGATKAEILEYIPIHHVIVGVAFAAWMS